MSRDRERPRIVAADVTGLPPRHEVELEAAVVAEALFDGASAEEVCALGLTVDDLYVPEHRAVIGAILRLRAAGHAVSLHSIKRELEARTLHVEGPGDAGNEWELVGRLTGIDKMRSHPPAGSLSAAVADLRAMAHQRRIGDVAALLSAEARTYRGAPTEFVERARAAIDGHLESAAMSTGCTMADAVALAVEHIDRVRKGTATARGIAIPGCRSLDSLFGGLRLGRMRTVGADTGGGKTTLALQEAVAVAGTWHNGERVGVVVISAEMDRRELALRALMCVGSLTERELFNEEGDQRDAFDAGVLQRLHNAQEVLNGLPIWIEDGEMSLEEIQGVVRQCAHRWSDPKSGQGKARPMVVVVDYLGIMKLPGGNGRVDRHERVALFTKGLKRLSRKENCHVTLLAQFNREGKRSTEASIIDFDGSGAIENDSDQVVIIDRPNLRLSSDMQMPELEDYARVRLAKSRVSKKGVRAVAWDGARYRLLDPTDEQQERWREAQNVLTEKTNTTSRNRRRG